MKNITIFILLLISVTTLMAIEPVALTLQVKGDVDLYRDDEKSDCETGAELINKDVLESMSESFAAIKFVDGSSVIKLFPNSVLTINTDKDKNLNKRSSLKVGELWAKVIKNTGVFEIDTPTTVISVKGTQFIIDVNENGDTDVITLEGVVTLENKETNQVVTVGAGNKGKSYRDGNMEVSETEEGDIDSETQNMIDSGQLLEINLENNEGESKTIRFDLE